MIEGEVRVRGESDQTFKPQTSYSNSQQSTKGSTLFKVFVNED